MSCKVRVLVLCKMTPNTFPAFGIHEEKIKDYLHFKELNQGGR